MQTKNWFQNFRELEGETLNTAANIEQKRSQLHPGDIVLKIYVGNKQEAVVLRLLRSSSQKESNVRIPD